MQNWPLEEARKHISDLVTSALEKGPQRVTRHGKSAVIVVSEDEWDRVNKTVPSFGRLLASFPLSREELPRRRSARGRKPMFE
jgi:prevent-host-death family protein